MLSIPGAERPGLQAAKCRHRARTKPKPLPASILRLLSLYSEAGSGVQRFRGGRGCIPAWAAGPISCAVLWGAGRLCPCLHLARCARRAVFASAPPCSALATPLRWAAEHRACGARLPSAPPCPSQCPCLGKSPALSSAQLCTSWSSPEAPSGTNPRENSCDGPEEAALDACPVVAVPLCFPGSCLLQPSLAPLASPPPATLLRNLSGELDLADGGCYLIPQKCFVIEKMETV